MKKEEKTKQSKPKYGMWSNSAYMIRLAWRIKEKKAIVLSVLTACLAVASQLVSLYVTPAILSAVERHVSAAELLTTILAFVGGIMLLSAASAYVEENVLYGRLTVRMEIIALLVEKHTKTSYPNLDDKTFQQLMSKANDATNANSQPAEAVWKTLTDLLKNLLGFAVYACLLVYVEPVLLAVILVTTALGYAVTSYLSGYGYRHREEEGKLEKKALYLVRYGCVNDAAKDIRIFGLRPWVEGLTNDVLRAYTAFCAKAEGVYLWAAILNVVLTFLRNGAAYFYLVSRVLAGEMDAAEFLLYFTAVDGFAAWVSGFLETLNTLHKQSIELSNIRECLEYPEPFRFEDGQELPRRPDGDYEIQLDNVSFRYPGADSDTLSNINLTLHPGEKLAVVGLNGAGKTTLVKLLCGFLETLNTLHKQSIELSNIRECLEYPEPFRFEDGQELPRRPDGDYEIQLDNVSFRYPGADSDTLSNINLTLHPGEKLAVVGLNGAGKTTLVKLLCGFLDPTSGRVLLNGQDIRVYNRRQYYELFSAVFQSFSLLPGSIAMNVAQRDEGIDTAKVERCIEMAGLTEKVASFSNGCETLLNRQVYEDAAMLSGGETQRLMLARALYKDAPVVVLDEPTAALDPIAEADLYQKYGDMTRGKSSVYISHRLASTRFCDRIILIDNGIIREEGTHDSLMQLGGKYAELYAVQSKYYQKEGNENEESR